MIWVISMTAKEKIMEKMCEKKDEQFGLDKKWMDSNDIDVESLVEALEELRRERYIKYRKSFENEFIVHPQKRWLEEYKEHCSED